MGIFDDLGNALKKAGEEVKKADLDRQFRGVEEGLNKAGRDISAGIDKARTPPPPAPAAAPASPPAKSARKPHPGYQKIAAWLKRNYRDRLAGSGSSAQKNLELEQLTAEACGGLSAKAKKGFLEYLKAQDYEPLLK